MAYTYILYSKKIDSFYTGACQEELQVRIEKHKKGFYGGKSFTSQADDWELFLY